MFTIENYFSRKALKVFLMVIWVMGSQNHTLAARFTDPDKGPLKKTITDSMRCAILDSLVIKDSLSENIEIISELIEISNRNLTRSSGNLLRFYKKKLCSGYSRLAFHYSPNYSYSELEELDSSRKYFNKVIEISSEIKDTTLLADAYVNIAFVEEVGGKPQAATVYYLKALNLFQLLGDSAKMGLPLNQLGTINYDLGNLPKALNYFYQDLTLQEKLKDEATIGASLNNIAHIHIRLEEYDKALSLFYKAVKLTEKTKDKRTLGVYYNNIGKLLNSHKHNTYAALGYLNRSLALRKQLNDEQGVANTLSYIGLVYMDKKDYPKAIDYYKQSLKVYDNVIDHLGLAFTLYNLGSVYERTGDPEQALPYAEKLWKVANEIKSPEPIKNGAELLSKIYKKEGDYKKSLEMFEVYVKMKDSVLNEKNKNNSLQKEYEHEYEKKEIAMEQKQKGLIDLQKQKNKFNLVVSSVVFLFISLLLYLIFIRYRYKREREKDRLLNQISEYEAKAFQLQMNPHFIFNCLTAVMEFIHKAKREEATKYLFNFSKLVRSNLEMSDKKSNTIENEIELLRLYMDFEKLRFNNNFSYEISIDVESGTKNLDIPPFVLQPIIENAIIHGIQNKKKLYDLSGLPYSGSLLINIKEEDLFLKCTVEDNGIGREAAKELKQKNILKNQSMGISITKKRLDIVGQQKGKISFFDVVDPQNKIAGTKVEILIPFM